MPLLKRNFPGVALETYSLWGRVSLVCLACAFGCVSGARPNAAQPVRHWVPGYVFGIWGKAELDVRDDCPLTGAAMVRVSATWSTLAATLLTLGLYTPREVQIQCRAAP
jgi:hypothetical protein